MAKPVISAIPITPPTTPPAMAPTFVLLPEDVLGDDVGIRVMALPIDDVITKALVEVGEVEPVDWAWSKVDSGLSGLSDEYLSYAAVTM